MITRCDVVVIGGGLAGSMAAIMLAQAGWQVVLLEAGTYPRAKVCGEFFSPECEAYFEAIGFLPALAALRPNRIRTLRITAPDGASWRAHLPAPAFGISRYVLDAALVQHAVEAGVTVHTSARATAIEGSLERGFHVRVNVDGQTEMLQAAGVIAAHGKRSNLDRVLGRAFFNAPQPYLGFKQHFNGPALPEHIDLHVFAGGYCGVSQVEDGRTNVCFLVDQPMYQTIAGHTTDGMAGTERFIAWMGTQNAALGEWLARATPLYPSWLSIAQVALCAKTPVEGGVLMAGDAAGMIAPLAGDGMAMALHSGQLAALAMTRYLRREQDASAMTRSYGREWARQFRFRLRLGRTLHRAMTQPRLLSAGLRVVAQLPSLGNWLVRNTRDLSRMERTS